MAVTLRLYKLGKKGYPTFKIVAVERRYKADGKYIESIGTYDPHSEPWTGIGAIISDGLSKLLKNRK